jgi:restriction system protein
MILLRNFVFFIIGLWVVAWMLRSSANESIVVVFVFILAVLALFISIVIKYIIIKKSKIAEFDSIESNLSIRRPEIKKSKKVVMLRDQMARVKYQQSRKMYQELAQMTNAERQEVAGFSSSERQRLIDEKIAKRFKKDNIKSIDEMSGTEFEEFVANELKKQNWIVILTPPGADQGLDIMATKGVLKVAVQCKRYTQPVGNSAVQEIHAARSYYDANQACVISTSKFTRSAIELARKLDVQLIHYSEISNMHRNK